MKTLKFKVQGLTCEACVKLCQLKIGKIGGVSQVWVDLKTGQGELEADRQIKLPEIETALTETDYKVLSS